jgi:hypothetical protein
MPLMPLLQLEVSFPITTTAKKKQQKNKSQANYFKEKKFLFPLIQTQHVTPLLSQVHIHRAYLVHCSKSIVCPLYHQVCAVKS